MFSIGVDSSKSPVSKNELLTVSCKYLNNENEIKEKFLSIIPAIKRLLEQYTPVLISLDEIQKEKGDFDLKNLIKYLSKLKNIIFLAYYCDTLEPLYILTKTLQKQNITLDIF